MVGWELWLYNWSANQQITKGIIETVNITEQRFRAKTVSRITSTENIFVFEGTANRRKTIDRLITETLLHPTDEPFSYTSISFSSDSFAAESDILARIKGSIKAILEITSIQESLTRTKSGVKAIGIEVPEPDVIVSDSIASLRAKERRITTFTSFEETSFTDLSFELVDPDAILVTDSATVHKLGTLTRTLTENTTIGEQIARLTTTAAAISESISIADTIDTVRAKIRAFADLLAESSDVLDFEISSLGVARTLTESEDITEDLILELAKTRVIEETTTVTDVLEGWVNNAPMQVEEHPAPPSSFVSAVRERYVRAQAPRPPRFEYAIENSVKEPLFIPARLANKVITPIRPIVVPLATLASGLRIGEPDKVLIRSQLAVQTQPHRSKLPLRLRKQSQPLSASLKIHLDPAHQALEPRKIINIERRYRTLKAYLLLHMIETLD